MFIGKHHFNFGCYCSARFPHRRALRSACLLVTETAFVGLSSSSSSLESHADSPIPPAGAELWGTPMRHLMSCKNYALPPSPPYIGRLQSRGRTVPVVCVSGSLELAYNYIYNILNRLRGSFLSNLLLAHRKGSNNNIMTKKS